MKKNIKRHTFVIALSVFTIILGSCFCVNNINGFESKPSIVDAKSKKINLSYFGVEAYENLLKNGGVYQDGVVYLYDNQIKEENNENYLISLQFFGSKAIDYIVHVNIPNGLAQNNENVKDLYSHIFMKEHVNEVYKNSQKFFKIFEIDNKKYTITSNDEYVKIVVSPQKL